MEVQLKEVKGKQLEALVYSSPVKFVLLPFFPTFLPHLTVDSFKIYVRKKYHYQSTLKSVVH